MSYHEKIQRFFKEKGLKQVEIAEIIGYTKSMTSKYLTTNQPNFDFITAISEAFPDIDGNHLLQNSSITEAEAEPYKKSAVQLIREIEQRLKELKECHENDTDKN